MFLTFTCEALSTHGRQFAAATRYLLCCALVPSLQLCTCHTKQHAPPRHIPHWWGEFRSLSSVESTLWSSSCDGLPNLAPTHESFHGFAGGSPGHQGTSSSSTQFISLWLRYLFSPAQRS